MPALVSKLNGRSDAFKANAAAMRAISQFGEESTKVLTL